MGEVISSDNIAHDGDQTRILISQLKSSGLFLFCQDSWRIEGRCLEWPWQVLVRILQLLRMQAMVWFLEGFLSHRFRNCETCGAFSESCLCVRFQEEMERVGRALDLGSADSDLIYVPYVALGGYITSLNPSFLKDGDRFSHFCCKSCDLTQRLST